MEQEKEELKSYIENDSKTMKEKLDKVWIWLKKNFFICFCKSNFTSKEKEALQKRIEEENRKLQEKIRSVLIKYFKVDFFFDQWRQHQSVQERGGDEEGEAGAGGEV